MIVAHRRACETRHVRIPAVHGPDTASERNPMRKFRTVVAVAALAAVALLVPATAQAALRQPATPSRHAAASARSSAGTALTPDR